MGSGSSQETHYTYVDNSETERREAEEKEKRRLENERKQREHEEKMRIKKEKEEEERRRREQLKEQRQKEIEEEEARRRAGEQKLLELEAELCRRRDQLFNYKFGDKTRLDNFMGLSIDDVTQLRIGVFGPTGSGKSCFINTCERAVRQTEKGSAPDSTTGQEGTITLQDYLPEMFFRLVDTRGFFNYNSNENIEFQNILFGKIQPGDNIVRPDNDEDNTQELHQCPAFEKKLHGIIIVVMANDPRLTEGALRDYLKPVRDVLRKNGIAPITVITHRDKLKTEDDEKDAFDEASAATGSSPSHTFFMWNYTKENKDRNPEIEQMTFDILHYALMTAEQAVKVMKQKENKKKREEVTKALEGVTISGQVTPDSVDELPFGGRKIEKEDARRRAEEQKLLELEAELCRRRDQLFNYKFGDKTRLDNFMGLNIDDVTQLRIGVIGPPGSGKSCFINTCERVVRQTEKGSAPVCRTGKMGTTTLQDYLPEMFFRLVDTWGFFTFDVKENIEFQNILLGKIQPGADLIRPVNDEDNTQELNQCPAFGQRLHGIIIVIMATDPRLTVGALRNYLKPVRDVLRKNGIAPITVITHKDKLKTEDDEKDAFDEASAATGSSLYHTFLMWNYNEENKDRNPEIEQMTFDILHYALMTAEQAVKIMKQQEKNKREDEMMKALEGVTISGQVAPDPADASVEVFLRFLQKECQWSTNSVMTASSKLAKDDITSVKLLAMSWSEVRHHFPAGMSRMIEKELRKRGMIS